MATNKQFKKVLGHKKIFLTSMQPKDYAKAAIAILKDKGRLRKKDYNVTE